MEVISKHTHTFCTRDCGRAQDKGGVSSLAGIFHLGITEGERCQIGFISLNIRLFLLMSASELALAGHVSLDIKSLF